jgi:hypothetical protein
MTTHRTTPRPGRPRSIASVPRSRAARPDGSWGVAISRAVESWDGLTGGAPADGVYSDVAAAAILSTALGLWADTAARMGEA